MFRIFYFVCLFLLNGNIFLTAARKSSTNTLEISVMGSNVVSMDRNKMTVEGNIHIKKSMQFYHVIILENNILGEETIFFLDTEKSGRNFTI